MMTTEERRKHTLLTLVELASGNSASDCFDDGRAMALLRSQSGPEELRRLGTNESVIEHIFAGMVV